MAVDGRPERNGAWAYAESYGRCIHFLTRAGLQLDKEPLLMAASTLAEEAMTRLYRDGMFQGYPESDLYESVDGVGHLCLALMYLATRAEPGLRGFGF